MGFYFKIILTILFVKSSYLFAQTNTLANYTWNTSTIYAHDSLWEKDFIKLEKMLPKFSAYRGNLFNSSTSLLNYLNDLNVSFRLRSKLYVYAATNHQKYIESTYYTGLLNKCDEIDSKAEAVISFFEPELIALNEEKFSSLIQSNNELKSYLYYFKLIKRNSKHCLLWEKEEIVSLVKPISNIPFNTYNTLVVNDFNKIKKNDTTYKNNPLLLYKKHALVFASLLNGMITVNRFNAGIRNFNSPLEQELSIYNIPISVYTNLIDNTIHNLQPLHEFVTLKSTFLHKDSLTYNDILKQNSFNSVDSISIDSAKDIITNACKILGKEYQKTMQSLFNNNWIKLTTIKTKIKNNLLINSLETHPYIQINWLNTFDDFNELLKLSAQAIHFNYATSTPSFLDTYPSSLTTSISVYINRILVLEYLIKRTSDIKNKKFLLENYINLIVNSFYKATMMADFEKTMYDDAEKGNSISEKYLCDKMDVIQNRYFGPSFKNDIDGRYMWTQERQLYLSFINYTNAVDLAIAFKLLDDFKVIGEPAVNDYIKLLKAGSSDDPLILISNYGIDITSTSYLQPVYKKLKELNNLLNQLSSTK